MKLKKLKLYSLSILILGSGLVFAQNQQQQDQQQQQQAEYKLDPTGWVSISVDYDNDGQYEGRETIYYYDLVKARETSKQRKDQGQQQRQRQGRQYGQRQQEDRQQRSQRQRQGKRQMQQERTVQGEITNLHTIKLTENQVFVAKVRMQDDRVANVLLGPKSQLEQLNLQEGDQIQVKGSPGHVNDKTMLVAKKIQSKGEQISVDLPQSRYLNRVRGEIKEMRTADFKGFADEFLIARVKLPTGKDQLVNLGPKSKVEKLNLQKNDKIKMLVRPGRINGQRAMIAEQIRANDKTIKLVRPKNTRRFGS